MSAAELRRAIQRRADLLFDEHRQQIFVRTDRLFAGLMIIQWIAALAAAHWVSPLTWTGRASETHFHVWAAVVVGGTIALFPVVCAIARPGTMLTRHVVALAQVSMSALLIHLSGGRIETHFHIFGSLAFIAFYRDWTLFVPATLVVGLDHFLRGAYWPESVYGVLSPSAWRWAEHAGWVLFEDVFLVISCVQSVREMRSIAWQRAELELDNERIEEAVVQRTAELHESRQRAVEAVEIKAQFLANMSHELRTPMNVIIGMTDMTLDSNLEPDQRQQLESVRSYACSLLGLLNEVLDLSKIEAGKLEIEQIPFDVRDMFDGLIGPLGVRAREKKIALLCDVTRNVPPVLVGDPGRLRQVLTNLVSNAIKFTERGQVVVRADVESFAGTDVVLHIAIADTGIGIPRDKQSVIFAPSFRRTARRPASTAAPASDSRSPHSSST